MRDLQQVHHRYTKQVTVYTEGLDIIYSGDLYHHMWHYTPVGEILVGVNSRV